MSDLLAPSKNAPSKNAPTHAIPTDASAATDTASWLSALGEIAAEEGRIEPLGPDHWAFFVDDGTTLMVSFEALAQARARPGQMPLAHDIAASHGWSHLCIIANGETWYRDLAVWAYFDRLVDDAFFDGFKRVLFYGAGMGGYAACAFAVTAPGAQVLALQPRATLAPAEAGWDGRARAARKLDFTSRYGYAPDMLEGAGRVVILHDPAEREDAMHASLFRAPHITRLRARHAGDRLEWVLGNLGLLPDLIEDAMRARLDGLRFAKAWRKRRDYGPYLRHMLQIATTANRPAQVAMICRSVVHRLRAPEFAKRLASLAPQPQATAPEA